MRRLIILIALLTVVLSACRLETNVLIEINDDGSAIVGLEVGLDEEFRSLIGNTGLTDGDEFVNEMFSGIDGDVVEPRVDGDMTYYRSNMAVDDLETWDWENAIQDGFFSAFSYTQADETAQFSAKIDGASEGDFGDFGDLGIDPTALTEDFFSAKVIVTMPGEIAEHNADEVVDGALIWNIGIGETVEAAATSNLGESSNAWIWLVVGAILLVGILSGTFAVIATRRESHRAVEEAAAAHEAKQAAMAVTEPAHTAEATEPDASDTAEEE